MERGDRVGRRLEISETISLRDSQRRPPEPVFLIPHFDVRALGREAQNRSRRIPIRRAVHCRLAVIIDGIELRAQIHCGLQRLGDFALGACVLAGRASPQSGDSHQRRGVVLVGNRCVRPERSQRAHQFGVRGAARQEVRSRARSVDAGQPQVHFLGHPRVDVRAFRHPPHLPQ